MKPIGVFLTAIFLCTCSGTGGGMLKTGMDSRPETLTYRIVRTFPHAPSSFTQGLVYRDGFLYEGTGQRAQSVLRKIDPLNGRIIEEVKLPRDIFGEGVTILDNNIYQLTWTSLKGFIYDLTSLRLLRTFTFPLPIEGWGLTTDGKNLIWSDGSSTLYFIHPESMKVKKRLTVTLQGRPIEAVNELEYVNGLIYANVLFSDKIYIIDPGDGKVIKYMDFKGLVKNNSTSDPDVVLNGIAYDSAKNLFYITGKNWDLIYIIKLLPEK